MTTPTREQVVQWSTHCKENTKNYWEYMTNFAVKARADLEATIAEKDAEIAKWMRAFEYGGTETMSRQLIEQQAHIKQLREALQLASNGLVWYQNTFPDQTSEADYGEMMKLEAALAIQSSTEALREHDAKLVERIADMYEIVGGCSSGILKDIADKIRKGEF